MFARGIRTGVPALETSQVERVEGLISDQAWKFNPSQLSLIGRTAQNWRVTQNAKAKHLAKQHAEQAKAVKKKSASLSKRVKQGQKELLGLEKAVKAGKLKLTPFDKQGLHQQIDQKRVQIAQAEDRINRLQERMLRLTASADRYAGWAKNEMASFCKGSAHLLAQRNRIGEKDCPFASVETWREDWQARRTGSFLFEGAAHAAGCNRCVKLERTGANTALLRFRLTEQQAIRRMLSVALSLNLTLQEFMGSPHPKLAQLRNACRWLEIEIPFDGKRQERKLNELVAVIQAQSQCVQVVDGKKKNVITKSLPVSWTVSWVWETVKGENGKPIRRKRFKFRAFWQKEVALCSDLKNGMIGVDVNAWGVSLC